MVAGRDSESGAGQGGGGIAGAEAQRRGRKTDDVMPSFPPHLVGNATPGG